MNEASARQVFENEFDAIGIVSDRVIYEQLGDDVVLLDLKEGQYYEFNGVGSRIWELIQEHGNLDQVLDVMLLEYEVDKDTLRNKLTEFVDRLTSQGWLQKLDVTTF